MHSELSAGTVVIQKLPKAAAQCALEEFRRILKWHTVPMQLIVPWTIQFLIAKSAG